MSKTEVGISTAKGFHESVPCADSLLVPNNALTINISSGYITNGGALPLVYNSLYLVTFTDGEGNSSAGIFLLPAISGDAGIYVSLGKYYLHILQDVDNQGIFRTTYKLHNFDYTVSDIGGTLNFYKIAD